jgi:hypothetical protein
VAKRFANNNTDIILQIILPIGLSLPYISKETSQELEVLLNMYGIYRKVNKNNLNPSLQDVYQQVICLELVGFDPINIDQINQNVSVICKTILQEI